jgi:hypothetical protein
MNKRRDERVSAKGIRDAARHVEFRQYLASEYLEPPTDPRFEELLKRLDDAARKKSTAGG